MRKKKRKRAVGKWSKSSPLTRYNRECVEEIVQAVLAINAPLDVHSLEDPEEITRESNRVSDINDIIDSLDQNYYDMMDNLRTLCQAAGYKHPHLGR